MANNNITFNDSCGKFFVNRKRKNKEMSKEDEEMERMIFRADNPFKMASELEETHIKYTKSVSGIKLVHRRMKSLYNCLLYTSPSPRDATLSRMPSSA